MAFTIYDACVPPLVYMLENLSHVLKVGEAHARENSIESRHYLEARLAPDMFALTKQVQVATDMAMRVTTDAVQVFGGYGYVEDYPVERYMREAKVLQIVEGTNQIQRVVIGRALTRP